MARIAILRGDKPDETSEAYKTFVGLSSIGQDEYVLIPYREVIFEIYNGSNTVTYNGEDLAEFDLVYIRDFHGYEHERNAIAQYLDYRQRPAVNSDIKMFQHISKLTQYLTFSINDVAIPKSLYGKGETFLRRVSEVLTFPLIVKSIIANSGNDNYLVNDYSGLESLLSGQPDAKLIVQEAVPNDGDYRFVVLGDKVSCVYHRKAQEGDHRNNVSQGGEKNYLKLDELPPEYGQLAIKAAQTVHREICGVDIMIDSRTNQPLVLEANFNFGIRAMPGVISEELYGLAEYLHDKANKQ
jgi:glutathione synthase/RimK-type ligase-like ATP-grasp enzyme